ncbi:MAG TPA: glycosyltransferase, partial [bacterium]|nr:glycosyltransferase [bacterium]
GVDPSDVPMGLVPVCLSPELPQAQMDYRSGSAREIRFIQGGIFWPWQDSSIFLNRILNVLERRSSGRVQLFGGHHPHHQIKGEKYLDPAERLKPGSRWEVLPMRSAEDLFADYARGGVAVDLMATNVERELSSAIRNVSYLWCGLPLICFDYSYLASDISSYQAGWVLSRDGQGLEELVESLLKQPDEIVRRGECAQQLVREKYTWTTAANSLLSFCDAARVRSKRPTFMQASSTMLEQQERLIHEYTSRLQITEKDIARRDEEISKKDWIIAKRDEEIMKLHQKLGECEARASGAERDLHTIRSKFVFRLYKRIVKLLGGE